ncbi:MAG: N-acetylmuramic acid 6-phosphate etherase [Planctomycetes bacterium]|nr:N-acetylmuramic acid 6-phosphate etherase [Planctomycetota bacterium]
MNDRGYLDTEHRNPRSMNLDRLSIGEAFDLINREDAAIPSAIAAAKHDVCRAIELVVAALRRGGRLIYVGAGTSGRLGVLDAAECPPTFLTDPTLVQGVIAGGHDALVRSIEGAEDHPDRGATAIDDRNVGPDDVVFGIATGGTTPFVHGALERARQRGARTVFFACVPSGQVPDGADVSIRVLTGPEVLTGSTRMKAGTATKLVLNMVSTIALVQLGKVHENLMVDVNTAANAKLVDRGVRIIQSITGRGREAAAELLAAAGGKVKTALVMGLCSADRAAAERLLAQADGRLAQVIERLGAMKEPEATRRHEAGQDV